MCGLWGWRINPDAMDRLDVHVLATLLAYRANERGDDSWGVDMREPDQAMVQHQASIGSIRKTCRISTILASQVMGHTRRATVGAITELNCHPFHIGKIIGAHNGHISNWAELNKTYNRQYEVDSQHIFAHIAENLPLSTLIGSGVVTYYNTDAPDVLYFGFGSYNNIEIYSIGPKDNPYATVWGSERQWLEQALPMAGIPENELWTYKTNAKTLYSLTKHNLEECGSFDLGTRTQYKSLFIPHSFEHCYGGELWNQSETVQEYWAKLEERRKQNDQMITINDINMLPDSLKKSQEKPMVEHKKGTKAIEAVEQCDACNCWGRTAEDYAGSPNAIVYYASVNEWLCYQCASWWGTETTRIPREE